MKKVLIGILVVLAIAVVISLPRLLNRKNPQSNKPKPRSLNPWKLPKQTRGDSFRTRIVRHDSSGITSQRLSQGSRPLVVLNVDEGDSVEKGVSLAVVEHEELELAVQQAEATLKAAETAYEQTKQLAEVRINSQIAQAKAQFRAAEIALQQVVDLSEIRTITQIEQAQAVLESLVATCKKLKAGRVMKTGDKRKPELSQADANLANARSNYERMTQLFREWRD